MDTIYVVVYNKEDLSTTMYLHKGLPILYLFLLGATLGTALDAFHVYSGVERYPVPTFLGVAWWVPLLFGAAAVAIGCSHVGADLLLRQRRRPVRLVWSLGEGMWVVLTYVVSASELDSWAKVGLLGVIYINFWVMAGRSWQNLVLSVMTAITGTLVEMVLVATGAFSYVHPDMLGVPYWLPCIYLCASLAVGDVGRALFLYQQREVVNEATH
jgi:hypothetical protein